MPTQNTLNINRAKLAFASHATCGEIFSPEIKPYTVGLHSLLDLLRKIRAEQVGAQRGKYDLNQYDTADVRRQTDWQKGPYDQRATKRDRQDHRTWTWQIVRLQTIAMPSL
ncbi:MAG: hypothetical protein VXZ82_19945 [Planctomycetota bacterium]|nr:hypothetical protein [Planctomycetota bacterium]